MATAALSYRGNGPRIKGPPRHSSDFVASEKDVVTNLLGWFSIGLGLAELFAPQFIARIIGIDEERHERLLRGYGVRELAAGVGILTRPKPTYWMWNRVIGDAIDLASLSRAMRNEDNDKARLGIAACAVAAVTALDVISSVRLTSESSPAAGHDAGSFTVETADNDNVVLSSTITVNRPVAEVYAFWQDPRNYAQFMDNIDSVNPSTGGRSRWKVKAPAGLTVEWEAEIVADTPNEMIRWRSTAESKVSNTGTVTFRQATGNRGTIVKVQIEYRPKAGPLGSAVAKAFSSIPKTQLSQDLRRFKQLIELGEVVQSDATAGRGTPHPAQPSRVGARQPSVQRVIEQEVRA